MKKIKMQEKYHLLYLNKFALILYWLLISQSTQCQDLKRNIQMEYAHTFI